MSGIKNISRIEFMVTYRCTGRCKHCSVGARIDSPGDVKCVDAEIAARTVKKLAEMYDVASVMTFGGEPLLYSDVVCSIHSAATESGIAKRQLITNGYFARDDAARHVTAQKLAAAGVNDLLISADAFHQERIPLDAVLNFAEESVSAGVEVVRLSPAWLVNRAHDNEYNRITEEIVGEFENRGIRISGGNDIFLEGNAAKYLADYYPKQEVDLSLRCGEMPYTAPLTETDSISIEPNGNVVACAFVIGNIYREPIEEIVTRYDPYADETMRALVEGGVPGLMKLAETKGITVDVSKFCKACQICRYLADKLQNI